MGTAPPSLGCYPEDGTRATSPTGWQFSSPGSAAMCSGQLELIEVPDLCRRDTASCPQGCKPQPSPDSPIARAADSARGQVLTQSRQSSSPSREGTSPAGWDPLPTLPGLLPFPSTSRRYEHCLQPVLGKASLTHRFLHLNR